MRTPKWVIFGVCLVIAALFIFNNITSNRKVEEAYSPASPFVQQPLAPGKAPVPEHHDHMLLKFAPPLTYDAKLLTAPVEYRVNSRTSAGCHSFWMDIYGELIAADGNRIQEMSIIYIVILVAMTYFFYL